MSCESAVMSAAEQQRPTAGSGLLGEPTVGLGVLLGMVASGDATALSGVYDRTGSAIYSLAYGVLGDQAEAAACVEEAFVSIWQRAPLFDPSAETASSWITSIVVEHLPTRSPSIEDVSPSRSFPLAG